MNSTIFGCYPPSTVAYGLSLGKELATFPQALSDEQSLNNILISEGANLILTVEDLLDFFLDLKTEN